MARKAKSSFLLWNCVHILLVILNMPMIGILVKLLSVPFRYVYPCVLFFIAIGVALGQDYVNDSNHTKLRTRGCRDLAAPSSPSGRTCQSAT